MTRAPRGTQSAGFYSPTSNLQPPTSNFQPMSSPDFDRKPPAAPEPKRSAWTLVLAAVGVLLAVVVLSFLTLNTFGFAVVVVAGIFAFAAVHYLVWGWWLSREIRREVEEEEREKNYKPPR